MAQCSQGYHVFNGNNGGHNSGDNVYRLQLVRDRSRAGQGVPVCLRRVKAFLK